MHLFADLWKVSISCSIFRWKERRRSLTWSSVVMRTGCPEARKFLQTQLLIYQMGTGCRVDYRQWVWKTEFSVIRWAVMIHGEIWGWLYFLLSGKWKRCPPNCSSTLYLFYSMIFKNFFLFWLYHSACSVLVPRPGIEPVPLAAEAQSLNHWATKEVWSTQWFCVGVSVCG